MGTLTADCPRLDTHCPHKLATSCRLTSTQKCCACADERPHSRLYRVYIDGVGFVHRGTRWQSYCWFCKEFWNNRLEATDPPLEAAQTQIPHIPDQTEFLERWFEFHQGYRIAKLPDGIEQRIAVIGEPFREVSPGFLPRTLAQLREGQTNDATRPENRFRRRRLTSEDAAPEEPQQSIEDALDSLLDAASDDDERGDNHHQADMFRRFSRSDRGEPASTSLQRTRERLVRLFGSRQDVERDDYESPLSSMYSRAEARYNQAEALRAQGATTAPPPSERENLSERERREVEEQIVWSMMRESDAFERRYLATDQPSSTGEFTLAEVGIVRPNSTSQSTLADADTVPPARSLSPVIPAMRSSLTELTRDLERLRAVTSDITTAQRELATRRLGLSSRPTTPRPQSTLDQPGRPAPLTDAQMTKKIDCQVCYGQLANIAVLPCGHMCMCQWCADIAIPVKHGYVPAKPSRCPMCRKTVKQRVKIHIGFDEVAIKVKEKGKAEKLELEKAAVEEKEIMSGEVDEVRI